MMEERDYIMRQIQQMVKGLGKFMGLEQIKEILQLSETQQAVILDEELESIILMSKVELIAKNAAYSDKQLATHLEISKKRLKFFRNNESYATSEERQRLSQFIKENQKHL